jgi:RecJ-like exonuclease
VSATCQNCGGDGEVADGVDCPACNGTGECDCGLCESCITASEQAWERQCEGEPPLSADERHQMAWRQKQELRR